MSDEEMLDNLDDCISNSGQNNQSKEEIKTDFEMPPPKNMQFAKEVFE
jgi:hypothetical protein